MRRWIAILTGVAGCGRLAFDPAALDARGDNALDDARAPCDAPGGRWTTVPNGGFESGDLLDWGRGRSRPTAPCWSSRAPRVSGRMPCA